MNIKNFISDQSYPYVWAATMMVTTLVVLGSLHIRNKFFNFHYIEDKSSIYNTWTYIGQVTMLYVYPIWFGQRYDLSKGYCSKNGLMQDELEDRKYLIYKVDTMQVVQPVDFPRILNVQIEVENPPWLSIIVANSDPLNIRNSKFDEEVEVTVPTGQKITVKKCSVPKVSTMLSKYILQENVGLHLAYWENCSEFQIEDPYVVINQTSVDHINSKIDSADICVHNFRPHIVIRTESDIPYEEDNWRKLSIGDAEFSYYKPCITTQTSIINPESLARSENLEPLRTLKQTSRTLESVTHDSGVSSNVVVMGLNLRLVKEGGIQLGDPVYIMSFNRS